MSTGTITVRTTKDGSPATAAVNLYLRSNSYKVDTKTTVIASTGEPAKATFTGLDFGVLYYAVAFHPGATIPSVVADYLFARPSPTAATDAQFSSVALLVDSTGAEYGTEWFTAAGGKLTMAPASTNPHAVVRGATSTPGGVPAAGGLYPTVMEFPPENATYFEVPGTINWTPTITVECWHKIRDNKNTGGSLISLKVAGSATDVSMLSLSLLGGREPMAAWSDGAGTTEYVFGAAVSTQTWHHLAIVQSGGTMTLYVDGVAQGTAVANSAAATQVKAYIGGYPGLTASTGMLSGASTASASFISAVRVTNAARYTADFTPPAAVFPNH